MKFRTRCLLALVALAVGHDALAQPLYCTPIRHGETAAQVAARITGEANGAREPWFQIVDPATSRLVPKARYGTVRDAEGRKRRQQRSRQKFRRDHRAHPFLYGVVPGDGATQGSESSRHRV